MEKFWISVALLGTIIASTDKWIPDRWYRCIDQRLWIWLYRVKKERWGRSGLLLSGSSAFVLVSLLAFWGWIIDSPHHPAPLLVEIYLGGLVVGGVLGVLAIAAVAWLSLGWALRRFHISQTARAIVAFVITFPVALAVVIAGSMMAGSLNLYSFSLRLGFFLGAGLMAFAVSLPVASWLGCKNMFSPARG